MTQLYFLEILLKETFLFPSQNVLYQQLRYNHLFSNLAKSVLRRVEPIIKIHLIEGGWNLHVLLAFLRWQNFLILRMSLSNSHSCIPSFTPQILGFIFIGNWHSLDKIVFCRWGIFTKWSSLSQHYKSQCQFMSRKAIVLLLLCLLTCRRLLQSQVIRGYNQCKLTRNAYKVGSFLCHHQQDIRAFTKLPYLFSLVAFRVD